MRRILLAAVCGLLLGLAAASAMAQSRVSDRQAEQAAERGAAASEMTRRTTALLLETLGDPAVSAASSPEALAAAVEIRAQAITDARTELGAINRDLSALPPISDAASPAVLRSIDQSARDAATLALNADGILEALQRVPEAVRTGDQARFAAAYRSVVSGAVLLHEAQALMMRAQGALAEANTPQSGQFAAMACFSDGQAAMQAGMSGLRARDVAVTQMAAAETCMREQVARGRSMMDAYAGSGFIPARLAPLHAEMFEAITEGAVWLEGVRQALVRGDNTAAIAVNSNPAYSRIIARVQDVTARQHRIMADQG